MPCLPPRLGHPSRPSRIHALVPVLALAVGCLGGQLVAQEKGKYTFKLKPAIPAPLQGQVPDLGKQSSWAQDSRFEGDTPDKSKRGVYAVGNGRVFTYMGLGQRANTMQGLTGPHYQTDQSFAPRGMFGELTLTLEREGKTLPQTNQRLRFVKGANLIVTEDGEPNGLSLRTLTFAQPDSTTIMRVITVTNSSTGAVEGVHLVATLDGKPVNHGDANLLATYESAKRPAHAIFAMTDAKIEGQDRLVTKLPKLAAGGQWTGVLAVRTSSGLAPEDGGGETMPNPETAATAVKSTMKWWSRRLVDTPTIESSNPRLVDLFNDWKVKILTMRCAQSGAVTPVVNERGCWIRKSTGPLLTMLRYNMWKEAKAHLDYIYNAVRLTNRISEHYPLDLDFAALKGKPKTNWRKIELPDNELASWIVMQYFWYYRATRDVDYIETRLPFMEACIKSQKRSKKHLMAFGDSEPHVQKLLRAVHARDKNVIQGDDPLFLTHNPGKGRRMFSMSRGALYLMGVQCYGEMVDSIDVRDNPKKYQVEQTPMNRPGRPYLISSFTVMEHIEEQFFMGSKKVGENLVERFAPGISPITQEPHTEPIANLNLIPMWIGWTFTTGERSRDNFRYTLHRLWRKGMRIGTTRNIAHFTGDVPGMILTGLTERESSERSAMVDEVLSLAEPAGEWGELYNPDGRPIAGFDAKWPNRMAPQESGINLDALFYAVSGVRHVCIPNFDNDAIKVKLRLPNKTTYVNLRNIKKDGRRVSLFFREKWAKLSPEERKTNANLPKDQRRDPEVSHRRFEFQMKLHSKEPWQGYWQVDANAAGTMFVRYITREKGIEEVEFWRYDDDVYFPPGGKRSKRPKWQKKVSEEAELLVLTNRTTLGQALDKKKTTIVDTGLPIGLKDIAKLLIAGDKLRHPKMFLDLNFNNTATGRTSLPASMWGDAWQSLLKKYEGMGGRVLRARPARNWERQTKGGWQAVGAGSMKNQWLDLGKGSAPTTIRSTITSDRDRDVILRIGASCSYKGNVNGDTALEGTGDKAQIADQDAVFVSLKKGKNTVVLTLGAGHQSVVMRATNANGLPADGIKM